MDWYLVSLVACGIPVQAFIAWHFGKLIVKGGWAAGCAVSVCRWGFAVGRVHGFSRSSWRWVPGLLLREWWAFFTSPYDSISQTCHGGSWRGIGQWVVFPNRETSHD